MSDQSSADAPDLKIPVPRSPVPVAPPDSTGCSLEVTVDGRSVSVPEGATLLDACRQCGVETPTLCYLETLAPVNVCRVCVVELEGSRVLVPACSRKAEPGMAVRTDTERVRLSRRMVLEFLASSTDVSTAPELQRYMERYGAEPNRYGDESEPAATLEQPVKVDNDLYIRDYGKCILCYKCVEACGEDAQNTFAIAVAGRGFDAHISTEFDVPLTDSACVYCGNCIGVCPTGALMFKSEHDMRADGTWDESKQRTDRYHLPVLRSRLHADAAHAGQPHRQGQFAAGPAGDVRKPLHQGPLRLAIRSGPRGSSGSSPVRPGVLRVVGVREDGAPLRPLILRIRAEWVDPAQTRDILRNAGQPLLHATLSLAGPTIRQAPLRRVRRGVTHRPDFIWYP